MSLPKPESLCRYRYDPLDRLASCLPLGQADTRCFYRPNRLTTEIQGQIGTTRLQIESLLLAQWRQEAKRIESLLIATDKPGSVLHALDTYRQPSFVYTPYGVRQPAQAPLHLPGFNGERPDPVTGHYLLGNGVRAFNPVLMRFNSPDSLSPFGKGGINAYVYCGGDPVNRIDPSGHMFGKLSKLLQGSQRSADDAVTFAVGGDPGIVRTLHQSFIPNTGSIPEMSAPRKALQQGLGPEERATQFGASVDMVNRNLSTYPSSNQSLPLNHAEYYASLAQKVSTGQISDSTAYTRSSLKWFREVFTSPHPRASLAGAVVNMAAAMSASATQAGALKTGAALGGKSTLSVTEIRKA
ncbi:RHS repeat-associated core domain-containing protein [Pseudomonas sp. 3A(2025)]